MEKRTPHCKLSVVKTLIDAGKIRMTASAVAGGEQLGFDSAEIVAVVMALTPMNLYKSMTTHADHTIWQDVYRPTTSAGDVYLKRLLMTCSSYPSRSYKHEMSRLWSG